VPNENLAAWWMVDLRAASVQLSHGKCRSLVTIGTRASVIGLTRTGNPKVKKVININSDLGDALHYQDTPGVMGERSLPCRN
jgi:hypothetical protein